MATLTQPHEGEINTNELSEYFQKIFNNKRGTRESLMKLASNIPEWEFSGSTDNIFKATVELFELGNAESNRTAMIGIQGGSGAKLYIFICLKFYTPLTDFKNKGSGKSFFLDNFSEAINKKTLFSLAAKNSSFTEERKESLREQCKQWENRMFALNISFNGGTSTNHFARNELRAVIPEEQIETEVALRVLFSL